MYVRMEKEGASARFTDSENEDDGNKEESKDDDNEPKNTEDYEKKRRRKTKEDIEREMLEKGDLYAILGL